MTTPRSLNSHELLRAFAWVGEGRQELEDRACELLDELLRLRAEDVRLRAEADALSVELARLARVRLRAGWTPADVLRAAAEAEPRPRRARKGSA